MVDLSDHVKTARSMVLNKMRQININFPALKEIALKGVRRAAVFMGLGINASADPNFKRYQLTHITHIQIVASDVGEEKVAEFKSEFSRWIVACGLRELTETFSVVLDEAHRVCLWMAASSGEVRKADLTKCDKKFRRKGLKAKLESLERSFDVRLEEPEYLSSLNRARNCLAHRRGIVGPEDCGEPGVLLVRWRGFEVYGETSSGERISVEPVLSGEGVIIQEGSVMKAGFPERRKEFALNSVVTFSPRDLAEICLLFTTLTDQIIASALEFAKKLGIPIMKFDQGAENEHLENDPEESEND